MKRKFRYLQFLPILFMPSMLMAQALEHKPKQLFISPEISLGSPVIINQNNYGYSEPGYDLTFGWQAGIMAGWDYFLRQSYKTGLIISKWGQNYSDILDHTPTQKKISNYYLQLPFSYKHVFGRKRGYDHEVFSPYVFATARIAWLFYSDVQFLVEENGNKVEYSLVDFVTRDNQWNYNTAEIIAQGNPEKDRHLFSPLDIDVEIGGGYQYFITRRISLFAEAHLMIGLMDINAGEWRFKNPNNVYKSSHNLYSGIKFGTNIYLFKNKR